MIKYMCFFFLGIIGFISCSTDSSTNPDNTNNEFTPPTTYYYKVDGISSNESADAPKASLTSGDFRLTKSFKVSNEKSVIGRMHMLAAYNSTIAADLAEGTTKVVYISGLNATSSSDSVQMYLEMDDYPTGIYDLKASTGKIYINKKNGILRFTSDGKITLTGFNNFPPKEAQTRTLEFSVENGISF
ncbi:MAG: hypothetical protein RO257_11190 [Candidatus Kapabacteria bacterium]|nr:hypothetical protein [Candidatus Kapabacteria bacterium]